MPAPDALRLARAEKMHKLRLLSLSFPAIGIVTLMLVMPLFVLVGLSFLDGDGGVSLGNYQRMLRPAYYTAFVDTFLISALVTLICVLLGYPLAYGLTLLPPGLARLGIALVLLPLWTSVLVRTYAWLIILQTRGVINSVLLSTGLSDQPIRLVYNYTGTVIGTAHILVPFLVLPLYASIRAIDKHLIYASTSLGASPARTFRSVLLPLSLPGLFAGATIVFVLSLGAYVTPAVLGGGRVQMWAMLIERSITLYQHWGAASALGVALLVATLSILYAAYRFAGLRSFGVQA